MGVESRHVNEWSGEAGPYSVYSSSEMQVGQFLVAMWRDLQDAIAMDLIRRLHRHPVPLMRLRADSLMRLRADSLHGRHTWHRETGSCQEMWFHSFQR